MGMGSNLSCGACKYILYFNYCQFKLIDFSTFNVKTHLIFFSFILPFRYMHRFCIESNKLDIFGFLDPFNMKFLLNQSHVNEAYSQSRLRYGNKVCY